MHSILKYKKMYKFNLLKQKNQKMVKMSDVNKDIGMRIRELRELSDITTEEIAKELDVDEETYISYENGIIDIPASFLYQIAQIFKVDLALILTGEETRMTYFDVTRADKGFAVDRRKEYKYENLCKKFVHKKAEMFIVTVDPKEDAIPSLNSHAGQEFNYILEGTVKIFIKDNEIVLNEGDSIFFDATCEHAMIALNDEKAKFLAVIM